VPFSANGVAGMLSQRANSGEFTASNVGYRRCYALNQGWVKPPYGQRGRAGEKQRATTPKPVASQEPHGRKVSVDRKLLQRVVRLAFEAKPEHQHAARDLEAINALSEVMYG
jgi:hypothetical protein